jgi:hypothetical protein
MTTTVRVLIEGNKACEVKVEGPFQGADSTPVVMKPGTVVMKYISGEQQLTVKEVVEERNE